MVAHTRQQNATHTSDAEQLELDAREDEGELAVPLLLDLLEPGAHVRVLLVLFHYKEKEEGEGS